MQHVPAKVGCMAKAMNGQFLRLHRSVTYVNNSGNLNFSNAFYGFAARPSLYLDSSVYVVDGDGSKSDPYIIGM